MCDRCRAEYANPLDRRFHAQAIACPQCGPVLVTRDRHMITARGEAPLAVGVGVLRQGGILALKGLGGFHVACALLALRLVRADAFASESITCV
jgi:hydrogenase maturation protein HypF